VAKGTKELKNENVRDPNRILDLPVLWTRENLNITFDILLSLDNIYMQNSSTECNLPYRSCR
jgi:hypothetical protein